MKSTPPRLTEKSAERMADVADTAGRYIDDGMTPDQAVAKAAAEHAMPTHHIPFVVRAVNTERTVRQFGSSPDPWVKAAAHPVASVEGVRSILGSAPIKVEKTAGDLSDYCAAPPVEKVVVPPMVEARPAPAEKAAAYDPSRWNPKTVPVEKPASDNRISLRFRAAAIVDSAAEVAAKMTPGQYAAAKIAAARTAPDGSDFLFGLLDAHPDMRKVAVAAEPDHRVRTDHPLVKAAADLEEVKAAYVEPGEEQVPAGYEKIANGLYRSLPICPILKTPIYPEAPAPAPEPEPVKAAGFLDGATAGAKFMTKGLADGLAKNELLKPVMPWGQNPGEPNTPKEPGRDYKLEAGLANLDTQAAVQSMLSDPRFAKSDPKTVIDAYRQYAGLAPRAMANQAIAADFIQRRLQTGPLSYYDLKALTDIEHNLARIRKADSGDDDDV